MQYTVEAVPKQVDSAFRKLRGILALEMFKDNEPPQAGNRAGKSCRCRLCLDNMAEVYTDLSVYKLRCALFNRNEYKIEDKVGE